METQVDKTPGSTEAPGVIIKGLAELPARAWLDDTALADALGVTTRTVDRMVARFELPPAVRIAGRSMWEAGRILDHFEARAKAAAEDAQREAERLKA